MRALLDELGVKRVRDAVWKDRSDQWANMNRLADTGVRANLVVGRPTNEGGTPELLVSQLAAKCPRALDSFEGANEWNLKGRPGWVNELRTHQRRLYLAGKANSTVSGLPVLGPSMGQRKDREKVGDISAILDRGNNHLYSGGRVPSRYVDQELAAARVMCGSKPVIVTEAGYHDALQGNTTHLPTSPKAFGIYAPRLLMEYARRGVSRVYTYELLDQGASTSDREQSFGLVQSNGTRKPVFLALRRLLDLLGESATGAWTPGTLEYAVSNADSLTSHCLMQRRDGRFLLALWRDLEVWDPLAKRDLNVAARTVTVHLRTSRLLTQYSPSSQEGPVRQVRGTSIDVPLAGSLLVIAIQP